MCVQRSIIIKKVLPSFESFIIDVCFDGWFWKLKWNYWYFKMVKYIKNLLLSNDIYLLTKLTLILYPTAVIETCLYTTNL